MDGIFKIKDEDRETFSGDLCLHNTYPTFLVLFFCPVVLLLPSFATCRVYYLNKFRILFAEVKFLKCFVTFQKFEISMHITSLLKGLKWATSAVYIVKK